MTKLHKTTTALLLAAALLLSGCAEQRNSPAQGTENISSDNGSSTFESPDSKSESTTYSKSEPESSSDSTPNASSQLTPLSFTDEDLELQKILGNLSGAKTVYSWFMGIPYGSEPKMQKIRLVNSDDPNSENYFYLIPENYQCGEISFPTNFVEMENTLNRFFTKQAAEKYMKAFHKGIVTNESDGVLDVTLEREADEHSVIFLEIEGRWYRRDADGTHSLNMDSATARVIVKGEEKIEFTFLPSYFAYRPNTEFAFEETYYDYAQTGYIVFEDGAWKLPFWSYDGFDMSNSEIM